MRAVAFDMDGTLIDSEPVWDDALKVLARELGGELSEEAREATVGTNVDISVGVIHADIGRPDADPLASGERLMELARERFAAGCGGDPAPVRCWTRCGPPGSRSRW